jgi:hypothetical protein
MSRRLFNVAQSIASPERSQISRTGARFTSDITGGVASASSRKMTTQ